MNLGLEDDVRLTERAAQWFGALKESNAERTAFFNWLAESPRHVEAFLSVLETVQEIVELTPQQRARVETMAGEAREMVLPLQAANVVPLGSTAHALTPKALTKESMATPPARWKWAASLAAGVLILAGGAWWAHIASRDVYQTTVGEQRTLELADGSIVYLNTLSKLEVRFTDTARSVRLLDGQALFKVHHDTTRPFVVESGDTRIQAVGTQFDVYRKLQQTRVAVLEGVVRISPPAENAEQSKLLRAGDNVDIALDGKITQRPAVAPPDASPWRQRRLVFREDTLGDIAAEFNRYNASLKIRVLGEAANNQHFSGTFDADAPEALMQTLAGDNSLIVERSANEIVIRDAVSGAGPFQ